MGNSRKATKKMDKQKKKKIYLGIFIAQILAEIFAVAEVISINMVPMKYTIVGILILVFYTLIVGLLLFYKRLKWQKVVAIVMAVIMIIGCLAGGIFIIRTMKALNGMAGNGVSKDVDVVDEPFTVYLSGSDTRNDELGEAGRSDVNILMVINPKTKQILLLNTPRDYYVYNPAQGMNDKLTHCGNDGIENSMAALKELYGIDIDYYGQINFSGFEKLIDELGGIDIEIPESFTSWNDDSYTFSAGMQHLNGYEALLFARERYAFSGGDNTRGSNQMQVIEAVIDKVTHDSTDVLFNYGGVMDSLEGMFKTSLLNGDIAKLVKMQLGDMSEWNIQSFAVVGTGASRSTSGGNAYVMIPDDDSVNQAKAMINTVVSGGVLEDTEAAE